MLELYEKGLTWCEARVTAQNRARRQELVDYLCSSGTKRTYDDELKVLEGLNTRSVKGLK